MHISASSQAEGRSKERGRPQKVSSSLSGPEGRGGAAVETVCCAFSRPQPDGGVRSPKRMLHGLARQIPPGRMWSISTGCRAGPPPTGREPCPQNHPLGVSCDEYPGDMAQSG